MRTFFSFTALLAAVATCATASSLPSFPKDWDAITVSDVVINQGGEQKEDGSVCCPPNAPQCKIQTVHQAAHEFFDYTNNRVANMNPDGSGVVSIMDDLKEYEVNSTKYCQRYCPIPKRQAQLVPFHLPNGSVDIGSTKYDGKEVELYQYKDKPFFNITFETLTYFIDQQNFTHAFPVHMNESLTPFGQNLGHQTQDWQQFHAGTPDPSHFTVKDKENCPIDPQCAQQDDDFPPSDENDLEASARYVMRIPGLLDSSFVKRVLNKNNRVEDFKKAASKYMHPEKVNEVVEYYNQFLSEKQRRTLKAVMQ